MPTIYLVLGEERDGTKDTLLAPRPPSPCNEGRGAEAGTREVVDDHFDNLPGKRIHRVRGRDLTRTQRFTNRNDAEREFTVKLSDRETYGRVFGVRLKSSLKFRARVSSVPRRSEGDSEGGTMKL